MIMQAGGRKPDPAATVGDNRILGIIQQKGKLDLVLFDLNGKVVQVIPTPYGAWALRQQQRERGQLEAPVAILTPVIIFRF
jgi:hypothetical protein